MAVVGVHSVWVRRWTLVCSSGGKERCKFMYRVRKGRARRSIMAVLTLDAASTCAAEPPSSAASHAGGASAPRPPVRVCGAAGSGGLWASAVPGLRRSQRGGGWTVEVEVRGSWRGQRDATVGMDERSPCGESHNRPVLAAET